MKKIIAMLVGLIIIMNAGLTSFASGSTVIWEMLDNFTADSTVSLVFENNDDIRALIEEVMEQTDSSAMLHGITSFLTAVFTYDSSIKIQADFSNDLQKIKLSLMVDNGVESVVSPNLNYSINAKAGAWADIDLTNTQNPVFNLTFLHPAGFKYYYVDVAKYLDAEIIDDIKSILNREKIDEINKTATDIMLKYADHKTTSKSFSYNIDNDGLIGYINEYLPYYFELISDMSGENVDYTEITLPEDIQILGDDGIQCSYVLTDGVATEAELKADICVDISKIYTSISGEKWPYASSGKMEFILTEKDEFSNIGKTEVSYPDLTGENTVYLNNRIDRMMIDDVVYHEPEPTYPNFYVYVYCDTLPVIDGEIYVPLRATLESAYEHTVSIDYNNGVVTAGSNYFTGFKTLSLTIGADTALTDGLPRAIGTVINVNGSTYVNSKLFTDVFGWELGYAAHDLVADTYDFAFYTDEW